MKDSELPINDIDNQNQLSLMVFDNEFQEEFNKVINNESIPYADVARNDEECTPDACDKFINMELGMPRGEDGVI